MALDADGRGEVAKEEAAGFQGAPDARATSPEGFIVRAKWRTALLMTTSAKASGKAIASTGSWRRFADGGGGVSWWQLSAMACGFGIGGVNFIAFAHEIDDIVAAAATSVEDAHAGRDVAAEELIKEVDIDIAELLL